MTRGTKIFIFISSLAISLLTPFTSQAQESAPFSEDYDSVAFVNGFSVSVDLVGIIQRAVSDYGQIEASLRLNLLDRYFPIIEAGVGLSKHEDVVTLISYKSNAPFFRIGMDYNLIQMEINDKIKTDLYDYKDFVEEEGSSEKYLWAITTELYDEKLKKFDDIMEGFLISSADFIEKDSNIKYAKDYIKELVGYYNEKMNKQEKHDLQKRVFNLFEIINDLSLETPKLFEI